MAFSHRSSRFVLTLGGVIAAGAMIVAAGPLASDGADIDHRLGSRSDRGQIGDSRGAPAQTTLPTTREDFFELGTQPDPAGTELDPILPSSNCQTCHGNYLSTMDEYEPWDAWVASMMGQAARDPVWRAAVAIANQDAVAGGESCIRCHSPGAWFRGHTETISTSPNDFANPDDLDGVTCHVCHRKVDRVYTAENPMEDVSILNDLAMDMLLPIHEGNAQIVLDPMDSRRGPYDDVPFNMHPAPILVSPHHRESSLCGTCHDVSNPLLTKQPDGTYALNADDTAHPTGDPNDMFPEQRTYSEWLNSQFATTGVQFDDGRFGGNHPTGLMQSCQDCHMPDQVAFGCFVGDPFPERQDLGQHAFAGANTWVLGAVFDEYGTDSGLTAQRVSDAQQRVTDMLRAASDMEVTQVGPNLKVRVINWSGHKLPTGYPEGRQMWLNVKFFDDASQLIDERGTYDTVNATLDESDTKIYRVKMGMDANMAAATGLPQGESFHLILNNEILSDNRIPPVGFTNAGFDSVQAAPVNYTYADGQHWDDTLFTIPVGADSAVVTLFYQTSTSEYIDFLDTENITTKDGSDVKAAWIAQGKSAPVDMDSKMFDLAAFVKADVNGSGVVNIDDLFQVLNTFGPCDGPNICPEDINCNGVVNFDDLIEVINNFGAMAP